MDKPVTIYKLINGKYYPIATTKLECKEVSWYLDAAKMVLNYALIKIKENIDDLQYPTQDRLDTLFEEYEIFFKYNDVSKSLIEYAHGLASTYPTIKNVDFSIYLDTPEYKDLHNSAETLMNRMLEAKEYLLDLQLEKDKIKRDINIKNIMLYYFIKCSVLNEHTNAQATTFEEKVQGYVDNINVKRSKENKKEFNFSDLHELKKVFKERLRCIYNSSYYHDDDNQDQNIIPKEDLLLEIEHWKTYCSLDNEEFVNFILKPYKLSSIEKETFKDVNVPYSSYLINKDEPLIDIIDKSLLYLCNRNLSRVKENKLPISMHTSDIIHYNLTNIFCSQAALLIEKSNI